jgi:hypothetical protein
MIDSVEMFIERTREDYSKWDIEFPWFRGEPLLTDVEALLPKLYRKGAGYGGNPLENRMLQYFRMKAPGLGYGDMPHREHTDQWLFLAQHVGLPTRLLDWTEGSLIAFYFALKEKRPVVWMLNPFGLNQLSASGGTKNPTFNIYGLTWYDPPVHSLPDKLAALFEQIARMFHNENAHTHDLEAKLNSIFRNIEAIWCDRDREGRPAHSVNSAFENMAGAWGIDRRGVEFPVAVHPTNIHPRMTAQRSVFTVQGKKREGLCTLLAGKDILKKYVINGRKRKKMLSDLRILGVSHATLFPDPDGLAKDLTKLFRPDLVEHTEGRDVGGLKR